MQRVIDAVMKDPQAASGNVIQVIVHIGALEVHSPEAVQQAYDMLVKGTPLATAKLKLEIFAGTLECNQCGYKGPGARLDDGGLGHTHNHEDGSGPHTHEHEHEALPYEPCPKCGSMCGVQGGRGVSGVDFVID
jgi:Zn finger protein HypA/HybF involved in hydrogenase expression